MTSTDTSTLAETTAELRRLREGTTQGDWVAQPLYSDSGPDAGLAGWNLQVEDEQGRLVAAVGDTILATYHRDDAAYTALLHNAAPALLDAIDALTAERDRLRAALAFYADPQTWLGNDPVSYPHDTDALWDHGDRARAALSPSSPVAERDGDG